MLHGGLELRHEQVHTGEDPLAAVRRVHRQNNHDQNHPVTDVVLRVVKQDAGPQLLKRQAL